MLLNGQLVGWLWIQGRSSLGISHGEPGAALQAMNLTLSSEILTKLCMRTQKVSSYKLLKKIMLVMRNPQSN